MNTHIKQNLLTFMTASICSATSLAGYLTNTNHSTTDLGACGGAAQLVRQSNGYIVDIAEVSNCSRITVNGLNAPNLQRSFNKGFNAYALQSGRNVITLSSGSGAHSETLIIDITTPIYQTPVATRTQPNLFNEPANVQIDFRLGLGIWGDVANEFIGETLSESRSLPYCGGTVTAEFNAAQDLIRLKFNNLEYCKNFDILTANGYLQDYENKKLNVKRDQTFAGSFDIPKRLLGLGETSLKVVVKSNNPGSGHYDVIKISYGNL